MDIRCLSVFRLHFGPTYLHLPTKPRHIFVIIDSRGRTNLSRTIVKRTASRPESRMGKFPGTRKLAYPIRTFPARDHRPTSGYPRILDRDTGEQSYISAIDQLASPCAHVKSSLGNGKLIMVKQRCSRLRKQLQAERQGASRACGGHVSWTWTMYGGNSKAFLLFLSMSRWK